MKITQKQLFLVMQVLADSLNLTDDRDLVFKYDYDLRKDLYESIVNQQSNIIKELE